MQLNEKSYLAGLNKDGPLNTSIVQLNPEDETKAMRKNQQKMYRELLD